MNFMYQNYWHICQEHNICSKHNKTGNEKKDL